MVEQVTFQTVFQFLQTVGILVGVFYYVMAIRANQRNQELSLRAQEQAAESRQAQLFMQISDQTFNNQPFLNGWRSIRMGDWETLEEWNAYRRELDPGSWEEIFRVGSVLETIGVIVKEGLVEIRLIDALLSLPVIDYWESWGSYATMMMKNDPDFKGYEAQYLYDELKRYKESTR